MGAAGKWLGWAGALSLLACIATVGADAASPVGDHWAANPDEQFLLDVKLHQYRLGDGVRAYNTPQGTCLVFGDFLTTLDVPMKIDLSAKKASGWAFKESNTISVDAGNGVVDYGGIFHDDVKPGHKFRDGDHRSFRPAQVLLHGGEIGFIDHLIPLLQGEDRHAFLSRSAARAFSPVTSAR